MPRTLQLLLPLTLILAGCVTNGGWVQDPSTFDPSAPLAGSPEDVRSRTDQDGPSSFPAEPNGKATDVAPIPAGSQGGARPQPATEPGTPQPGARLALGPGEATPVEVFVLPVLDESRAFGAPLGVLREELAAGLVELRYSPISLAYGDAMLSAANGGEGSIDPLEAIEPMEADALLQVRLGRWNTDQLESRGLLRAQIEISLWRGDDPRSPALWTGRVEQDVEVPARSLRTTPRAELEADCARRLVGLLLADLPPRP